MAALLVTMEGDASWDAAGGCSGSNARGFRGETMVTTRRLGRTAGAARAVRALGAGGLVLALMATPVVADDGADEGDEEVEEEDDPKEALREAVEEARAQLRTANQQLAAARSATRAARATGRAADGAVRRAEEQVVPDLLARREAEEDLEEVRAQVAGLRRELRKAGPELEAAQQRLADRAVRAYKHGSIAADTALPLLAAREASSPGELAQVLKDLEVLALTGATEVGDLIERIARLEAELTVAVAARSDAEAALDEAVTRVDDGEATATARRRSAADAEQRLLGAIERELAAEQARDEARTRLDAALAELGTRDDGDDGDDGDTDDDTPADHLRGRQRAHARQVSLPLERRRTSDDWVCPVEGSRFINDWAFPRSQDRKHEGTDVFAPTGTPIVAVTDGVVVRMTTVDRFNGRSGFGGITVSYERGDERFYNAHLDAIHPDMTIGHEVEAGDVIGWVGRTGNARGTPPHLHLGWYIDDVAVNPYGSLAVACHGTDEPEGDRLPDDVEELTDVMSDLRQ
jgi:murein DD-endopeptidase MepM/ murein hydrolase activator NlpD